MDVDAFVSQVFPYVRSAVAAYGPAVLSGAGHAAADNNVRHGQRLIAAVLQRDATRPRVEEAVRRLAGSQGDPAAAEELHDRIRQALREDPALARHVAAVNVPASWTSVQGHHNVTVSRDHTGPIHMGDHTSNVHHTVHNNIHERKISGFSIAALVLGLLGFLILPIPIAIVFGLLALTQVLRSPSAQQAPGADQAGGGAVGPGGSPSDAGPREAMTDPTGSTGANSGTAVNSTPRPAEPTVSAESGASSATAAPDVSAGQTGPSATGAPPVGDPAAPAAPDVPASQWSPAADTYTPPAFEPAAASTPFTPPVAETSASFAPAGGGGFATPAASAAGTGFAAPAAPAAGAGFAAAKAISVVFSLFGLMAAGLWGLGWTAAAVIVAQADSGYYASEGTDPSFSSGGGEVPSPADLCEPSPGYATVCTLQTGDCFIEPATTEFYEVELTSCDEPHNAEVIGSYSPSGSDWPGEAAFYADIDATCSPMSDSVLDPARTPATYYVGAIMPNQDAWEYGIQEAFCYVSADGESWTTSLTS